jgi:alpha-tubulin suppressor-like RCC1 family protein
VVHMSCSLQHSLAVTSDGTLWSCGSNDSGELGRLGRRTQFVPVDALEAHKIELCSAGSRFSSASSSQGALFSWGTNVQGELGLGDREPRDRPKRVPQGVDVTSLVQLEAGESHQLALTSSGTVVVWGAGRDGQVYYVQESSLLICSCLYIYIYIYILLCARIFSFELFMLIYTHIYIYIYIYIHVCIFFKPPVISASHTLCSS